MDLGYDYQRVFKEKEEQQGDDDDDVDDIDDDGNDYTTVWAHKNFKYRILCLQKLSIFAFSSR